MPSVEKDLLHVSVIDTVIFSEPSLSPTSTVLYTNGAVPYTFQNGVAVFGSEGYAAVPQQVKSTCLLKLVCFG